MSFVFESPDFLRAQAMAHDFGPHMHSTYSVVVLESGAATLHSKRWADTACEGDIFFFNPFEVHTGFSVGQPASYKVLYLSQRSLKERIGLGSSEDFLYINTGILRKSDATEGLSCALSCNLADSSPIQTALGAVLNQCSFTYQDRASNRVGLVPKVLRYISEHYMQPIRTRDVADHIGVHKSHLIREFKRSTGIAPETYVRQLRIARAQELICAGGNLSDIALSLSFCDQAHLTREFKKVFGVSPGALSRNARQKLSTMQSVKGH